MLLCVSHHKTKKGDYFWPSVWKSKRQSEVFFYRSVVISPHGILLCRLWLSVSQATLKAFKINNGFEWICKFWFYRQTYENLSSPTHWLICSENILGNLTTILALLLSCSNSPLKLILVRKVLQFFSMLFLLSVFAGAHFMPTSDRFFPRHYYTLSRFCYVLVLVFLSIHSYVN